MRWTACMVFSSGATNSAAYPARKISAATMMVKNQRAFMFLASSVSVFQRSFFLQMVAREPRRRKKHNIKSSQKRDPGPVERGLFLKKRSGRFDRSNQQRCK